MKFINSQQLAFLLDIKKEDARAKMCFAWAKSKGIENTAYRDKKTKKLKDDFPLAMEVEMLAKELNLPTLPDSIKDITDNFLKRSATKKWILCDYPEKEIKRLADAGKPKRLRIPPALSSMLPPESVELIQNEWKSRYGITS